MTRDPSPSTTVRPGDASCFLLCALACRDRTHRERRRRTPIASQGFEPDASPYPVGAASRSSPQSQLQVRTSRVLPWLSSLSCESAFPPSQQFGAEVRLFSVLSCGHTFPVKSSGSILRTHSSLRASLHFSGLVTSFVVFLSWSPDAVAGKRPSSRAEQSRDLGLNLALRENRSLLCDKSREVLQSPYTNTAARKQASECCSAFRPRTGNRFQTLQCTPALDSILRVQEDRADIVIAPSIASHFIVILESGSSCDFAGATRSRLAGKITGGAALSALHRDFLLIEGKPRSGERMQPTAQAVGRPAPEGRKTSCGTSSLRPLRHAD
jgi:hypothetical protein